MFGRSYKRLKEQMHLKEKERATARVNHQRYASVCCHDNFIIVDYMLIIIFLFFIIFARNLTALMKHTREVKTLSNFLAVNQLVIN